MRTLDKAEIMRKVLKIRNGTVARVTYKSSPPVKAEFKKLGYQVIKITDTTGRFGVKYSHIQTVSERKSEAKHESTKKYTNNYVWVVENKVKHNINTNKDYLVLANFNKGHNTKVLFKVTQSICNIEITQTLTEEQFMNTYASIVQDSYFTHSAINREIRTIAFENVIRINDVGEKISF